MISSCSSVPTIWSFRTNRTGTRPVFMLPVPSFAGGDRRQPGPPVHCPSTSTTCSGNAVARHAAWTSKLANLLFTYELQRPAGRSGQIHHHGLAWRLQRRATRNLPRLIRPVATDTPEPLLPKPRDGRPLPAHRAATDPTTQGRACGGRPGSASSAVTRRWFNPARSPDKICSAACRPSPKNSPASASGV